MGYVYILVNDSMPGLIKIGKTARNSRTRARELSNSTGVPTPFEVAFELSSKNYEKLESEIHIKLAKYRVSQNREFFKYPEDEAIRLLKELHFQRITEERRIAKKELEKVEKTRINCYNESCAQELWIPITNRTLEITCPRCKAIFRYNEYEIIQKRKMEEKRKRKIEERRKQEMQRRADKEKQKQEKADKLLESLQKRQEETQRRKTEEKKEKIFSWIFWSVLIFFGIGLLQILNSC